MDRNTARFCEAVHKVRENFGGGSTDGRQARAATPSSCRKLWPPTTVLLTIRLLLARPTMMRSRTAAAVNAAAGMGAGTNRAVARRRRCRFGGLRAGKGLPEPVHGRGQCCKLFGQALGVSLLCGDQPSDRLQLPLHSLQLIDRFLLAGFQSLGLLHQLLGGLSGAGLQLAG